MNNSTYPPEEFLEQLRNDPCHDFHALMATIKPYWEFSEWVWKQEGDIYYISTYGWSGNEEIIHALRENTMFYPLFWMRESLVREGSGVFHGNGLALFI